MEDRYRSFGKKQSLPQFFEMDLEQFFRHFKDLDTWRESFGAMPLDDSQRIAQGHADRVLTELVNRLKGNYPFHHPQYAGQMLKPPHELAMQAYMLAMTINPNNHALDGGPPTSEMEKEVVAQLAQMVGYGKHYLGHLTSSGTIANLEALWVARESRPNKAIAFSSAAHYTHARMCEVLNVKAIEIPVASNGKMDLGALEDVIERVGTVVVTMGTTGLGLVEDLPGILDLCRDRRVRVHVDGAYGGFFKLLESTHLIDDEPWSRLAEADSFVVDPHKHGLQPYGCGSVLFRDAGVGKYYKHDSPYTYFSSDELHLGEISLECSRAGASAAALWATLQCFPLSESGLGRILAQCRNAAREFYDALRDSPVFAPLMPPDLDIVAYFPVRTPIRVSDLSELSKRIFQLGMEDPKEGLYLSLYRVPSEIVKDNYQELQVDQPEATLLRSVLMKPEHRHFVPELIRRLEKLWMKAR